MPKNRTRKEIEEALSWALESIRKLGRSTKTELPKRKRRKGKPDANGEIQESEKEKAEDWADAT